MLSSIRQGSGGHRDQSLIKTNVPSVACAISTVLRVAFIKLMTATLKPIYSIARGVAFVLMNARPRLALLLW
ncbi:hypothetical protein ES703_65235 [subsurface metagenome]